MGLALSMPWTLSYCYKARDTTNKKKINSKCNSDVI